MFNRSASAFCSDVRVLVLLLCLQLPGPARAAENHWMGTAGDNRWTNAANWSLGIVPDYTQDVFVEQTGTNAVVLDVSVAVASLSLGDPAGPATLNIAGGQFECYGDSVIATNAVLNLAGDFFGYGSLAVNGTINWTAGSLSAGAIAIGAPANLNISGAGSKTLGGRVANDGTVSCFATNLNAVPGLYFTNNHLFVLQADFALSQSPGNFPYPEFHNNGTVLLPAEAGRKIFTLGVQFYSQGTIEVDTNAVLEIASDYYMALFQNGSLFNGAGLLRIPLNSSVILDGLLTVNGTVEFAGNSTYGGWPTWTGPGLLRWTGGGMSDFTFAPGFHVEMTGPDDKSFAGGCTNLGTVQWQSSGRLLSQGYSGFVNLGQFAIETNCVLDSTGWPSGCVTNAGVVLRPAGSGTAQLQVNNTAFINQGTIEVDTNAVLEIASDYYMALFQNGSLFNGAGLLRIPLNSSVILDGILTVNGTVEFAGNSTYGGWPTWTGPGLLRWTGGGMSDFTFAPGFHVEMTGPDDKSFSDACTNLGIICWTGNSSVLSGGGATFVNGGLFLIKTNGNWDAALPFANQPNGTLRQITGQFSLGTLNNSGALELEQGLLQPANFVATSSGNHRISLSGSTPGTGFNQLNAQTLALDGSLMVTLTNGFVPTNGNSFTIATGGSRTGQFANVTLPPTQSNLTWRVRYTSDAVILQASSPLAMNGSTHLGDGRFQFMLSGPAAGAYVIQASTNLVDWFTVETNSPFPGNLIFTDLDATNFNWRFYRCQIFD